MSTAITKNTAVAGVLERLPEAIYLIEEHDVTLVRRCRPMLQVKLLAETPSLCRIEELDRLIDELNTALDM